MVIHLIINKSLISVQFRRDLFLLILETRQILKLQMYGQSVPMHARNFPASSSGQTVASGVAGLRA